MFSLRRSKPDAAPSGAPGPQARGQGSLAGHGLAAFALIALVVLAGWQATRMLQAQATGDSRLSQAAGVARLLAADISASLLQARAVLGAAADRPEVRRLTDAPGSPETLAWGERVARMLPGALRVRLLPAGWDQLDDSATPHLSFASLELVREAERSGAPTAFEVHHPGSDQAHVAVVLPVKAADGSVVGTVHAALSPQWLGDLMAQAGPATGAALGLRQRVSDGESPFVAGSAVDDVAGAVPVEGSIWEVAYRPLPGGYALGLSAALWVVPLVMLGLVALALLWQVRRVQRALRADQVAAIEVLEGALSGRPPMRPPLQLVESEPLLARVESVRASARRGAGEDAKAQEKRRGGPESGEGPATRPRPDEAGIEAMFGRVSPAAPRGETVPREVFKAYDIRGIAGKTLTPEVVTLIGRAIGSEAYDRGQQTVIIGRDCRPSGEELADALTSGLRQSGRDVVDLGMVPTPLVNFATHFLGSDCGVMITGSHNPPEYNGLKIVLGGEALSGDRLLALADRAEHGDLLEGEGELRSQDLLPDYVDRIASDVRIARPMTVVVDCGNGAAGIAAPTLLRTLGCEVIELFCEPDGAFPNHHPDPSRPDNLQALLEAVQREGADLGIAYDGDGDRLGVVDNLGKIIWPDRLLMLFAQDVLSRQPGADIIYDVKSSRHLASHILLHGGRPLMWKSGHSLMRAKLKETGALLAGEFSGHVFFEERWYGFDDALYASARLLEILGEDRRSPGEVFAELPDSLCTPELQATVEGGGQEDLVKRMVEQVDFDGATLTTIDGLRAEFGSGWGLVRASNTTPSLIFRFEADDERSLAEIEERFRTLVRSVAPELELPF
ncbi:MAG: phosphomannomutase/phosphoglucomutase [Chromatiales bacterium]|jgi:phosphomannomutase/phosphoglucomutase